MRLIDADALILHLNDYALTESPNDNETTEERRMSEMVYRVIHNCIKAVEEQPTAYDPEAVVAELEDKFEQTVAEILDKTGSDFTIADFNVKRYSDRICEIVRKGGVE